MAAVVADGGVGRAEASATSMADPAAWAVIDTEKARRRPLRAPLGKPNMKSLHERKPTSRRKVRRLNRTGQAFTGGARARACETERPSRMTAAGPGGDIFAKIAAGAATASGGTKPPDRICSVWQMAQAGAPCGGDLSVSDGPNGWLPGAMHILPTSDRAADAG